MLQILLWFCWQCGYIQYNLGNLRCFLSLDLTLVSVEISGLVLFLWYCWGLVAWDSGTFWQKSTAPSAAAPRRRLHWSALNLHVGLLCASGCCSRSHSLLDLSSHGHEGLFDIGGVLSASFQERDSKRVSKFLENNRGILVPEH